MTGGQTQEDPQEDGGDGGRMMFTFEEDVEIVRCFIQHPDKTRRQVFSIIAEILGRWDENSISNRYYKYIRGDPEYFQIIMKHISMDM